MFYSTKEAGLPFKVATISPPSPPSNGGGARVSEETLSPQREENLVHEENKDGKAGEVQKRRRGTEACVEATST